MLSEPSNAHHKQQILSVINPVGNPPNTHLPPAQEKNAGERLPTLSY